MLSLTNRANPFINCFRNMNQLREFVCDMNIGWLIGSILDIISINIMFYAIKSVRWLLFIPHLICR